MTNLKKYNVMEEFEIDEISSVDMPAQVGLNHVHRAIGVNDDPAFRIQGCEGMITLTHTLMECQCLQIEPVHLVAMLLPAGQSCGHIDIEKERQIRFQTAGGKLNQRLQGDKVQTASVSCS